MSHEAYENRDLALRQKQLIRIAGFSSDFAPARLVPKDRNMDIGRLHVLLQQLNEAIRGEYYLEAARVRDEIHDFRSQL